jgi:tRNA(Ile)-lysidine synthase
LSACTTRVDVAARARERRDNLEKVAREARYEWLAGMARARGAAWVATGHSADDQAETVLHRLLRGTGLQGLAAILPRRPVAEGIELVRPLLTTRRGAILAYLREQRQGSCHDSSNEERRYTRNRIRLDLLPLLTVQYQPAIVDILCRLAEEARAVHRDVRAQAGQMLCEAELPRAGDLLVFDLERLERMPPHLVREVFRLVWQREGWPMSDMNRRAWHVVVELARGRRTGHDFPGRIRARRRPPILQVGRSTK